MVLRIYKILPFLRRSIQYSAFICVISIYFLPSNKNIYTSKILPEIENTMAAMSAESEGATTDDDVHLSPSSVCSSASGGGRGGGGGARGGGGAVSGGVRFKILCSFGGRIMPRPSDGALKYIGGETRVLAVHRSIPFASKYCSSAHGFQNPFLCLCFLLM